MNLENLLIQMPNDKQEIIIQAPKDVPLEFRELIIRALTKNRNKTQLLRMRKADPLVKFILHKIFVKRENCVIKILGKVQRGKSTIALELAWRIMSYLFNVGLIIWYPEMFSDLYAKGVKRGDVMIYEEIGTEAGGLPRRRWYDFNNLLLLDIMQTHGFEGTILILTLPSSKYLDSNTEPLIDIEIEAKSIDRRNGLNYFTAYEIQWNEELQKSYKHCLIDEAGNKVELYAWKRTIPKELIADYKVAEQEFKRHVQARVNELVKKKNVTLEDETDYVEQILNDLVKFTTLRNNKLYVNKSLIENEFNIGRRISNKLKLRVEREILNNEDYKEEKLLLQTNLRADENTTKSTNTPP